MTSADSFLLFILIPVSRNPLTPLAPLTLFNGRLTRHKIPILRSEVINSPLLALVRLRPLSPLALDAINIILQIQLEG